MAHSGNINLACGMWEPAIAYSRKALEAFILLCPSPPMAVMACRDIADANAALERPIQSLEYFQAAIPLADHLVKTSPIYEALLLREKAVTLIHRGATHLNAEQPEAAVEFLNEARALLEENDDAVKYGLPEALEYLATAHQQVGTLNPAYALGDALALPGISLEQKLRLQLVEIQLMHLPQAKAEPVIHRAIEDAKNRDNAELGYKRCGMV